MGLFDDFSELFAGINELGDEIRGLKEDFISSVIEPGKELKETVNDIASSVSGTSTGLPSTDDTLIVPPLEDVVNDASKQ